MRELKDLQKTPPPNVCAAAEENNLFHWTAVILGDEGKIKTSLSLSPLFHSPHLLPASIPGYLSSVIMFHPPPLLLIISTKQHAGTPYEGGIFFLDVKIPPEYPFKPPEVLLPLPLSFFPPFLSLSPPLPLILLPLFRPLLSTLIDVILLYYLYIR